MGTKHFALIVGLALVASAGAAVATYAGQSIWGANNPGHGGDHAAEPGAGLEHNRAGEDHPSPDHNQTHDGDGNETDDGGQIEYLLSFGATTGVLIVLMPNSGSHVIEMQSMGEGPAPPMPSPSPLLAVALAVALVAAAAVVLFHRR
jgi:hypothetical protein